MREEADFIIREAIQKVLPDEAVAQALARKKFGSGKIYVVAAGKAAWQMAKAASDILGECITAGVVCTKYDHVKAEIPGMTCYEGGHPVPDHYSFVGTQAALDLVKCLQEEDTVLFLLSGGGSALFEKPLISEEEIADVTNQLLASGADIVEINTVRKRFSAVKGGKFAKLCEPAQVYSIVLSDILGDPLDMIASGPAYPDSSTCNEAVQIAEKYNLKLSEYARTLLTQETPKELCNVETIVTGSVRNQELALAAAEKIAGLKGTAVFSVGSDGTDGPTDAAGGYCDGSTKAILETQGVSIHQVLQENDAYHALEKTNGLIITGATGTNVNDVAVVLIRR